MRLGQPNTCCFHLILHFINFHVDLLNIRSRFDVMGYLRVCALYNLNIFIHTHRICASVIDFPAVKFYSHPRILFNAALAHLFCVLSFWRVQSANTRHSTYALQMGDKDIFPFPPLTNAVVVSIVQDEVGAFIGDWRLWTASSKIQVSFGVGSFIRSSSAGRGLWPEGPASTLIASL